MGNDPCDGDANPTVLRLRALALQVLPQHAIEEVEAFDKHHPGVRTKGKKGRKARAMEMLGKGKGNGKGKCKTKKSTKNKQAATAIDTTNDGAKVTKTKKGNKINKGITSNKGTKIKKGTTANKGTKIIKIDKVMWPDGLMYVIDSDSEDNRPLVQPRARVVRTLICLFMSIHLYTYT